MKKIIKKLLPASFSTWYSAMRKQRRVFSRLTREYGQFQTIRKWSCVDREGAAIPWYTYPAIEYLSHLDFSQSKVLEYGSGNSTLWWAERCEELCSVEGDLAWHAKISTHIAKTSRKIIYLLAKSEREYIRQSYLAKANVIVIDGDHRSKCADWVVKAIQGNTHEIALIVFDNADWYPKTMKMLRDSLGWIQADFHGFGPINDYSWTTTVFLNPASQSRLEYARPLKSICGLSSHENPDDSP
jgi:hypothetical protein